MEQATPLELREVGLSQRLMVWGILLWPIGFFPPAIFITIPFQLYCTYRLARALKLGAPATAISMLLILVPLICLLPLIWINLKGIDALRAGGIPVGLMGARKEDLPARESV